MDTHVHLTDDPYVSVVAEVMDKAIRNGVSRMLVPGYSMESCRKIAILKAHFPSISVAAGFHPMFLSSELSVTAELREIHRMVKISAIGEIGLDKRKGAPAAELQEKCFYEQLELAVEWSLPVLVHCVHDHDRCISVLRNFIQSRTGSDRLRGVIHRVSCSAEIARSYLEMGFYFGLGPDLFDARRTRLVRLASWIPETHILLETDSPYSRKRDLSVCDPWELPEVLKCLSEIRGTPVDRLAQVIAQNNVTLFGE